MGGWCGVVCKVIFVSNPTNVYVVLSWAFDNNFDKIVCLKDFN